jgi:hypothetical protein
MKRGLGALSILLLLWVGACSKESFFGESAASEPEAKVLTIPDGTILSSSEIPLSLAVTTDVKKKDLVEPYTLSASILSLDGTEVASVTLDRVNPQSGPLPALIPPQLPPGTYTLQLTLKKGSTQTYQNRVTFFVAEGLYELERISLFPPSVLPFSTAIVQVALRIPSQSDPWIRWTIQGKVVQEKLYSQGGAELRWTSPEKEGVYPVRVDLFPHPPREGTTYSFASPTYLTSQLVVSSTVGIQDTDLKPESSHWSLFHFMGNLQDSGYRKNKAVYGRGHLKEIGSPQVQLKETVFGYYLDGKSGFVTEQFLLSFDGESPLGGFTLRFRLRPGVPVEDRTWFETKSKEGTFHLKIQTNTDKKLEAFLEVGGARMIFPSRGTVQEGRAQLLELSFTQVGKMLQARWSFEGVPEEPVEALELPEGGLEAFGKEGVSWIGIGEGGSGFVGILDEFGIWTERSSSVSTAIGTKVPIRTEGKVEQTESGYILSPGSSLYCGPLESRPQEISLSIEKLANSGVEIRLLGKGRDAPWAIISGKEGKWNIAAGGKEFTLPLPGGDTIKFSMRKDKEKVTITWNEVTVSVTADSAEPETFSLQIYHAAAAVHPLGVKDIRVVLQN